MKKSGFKKTKLTMKLLILLLAMTPLVFTGCPEGFSFEAGKKSGEVGKAAAKETKKFGEGFAAGIGCAPPRGVPSD